MSLKELAVRLGIKDYPDALAKIYDKIDLTSTAPVDFDMLREYHDLYNICGEHYDAVVRGGEAILKNEDVLAWGNIAVEYLKGCGTTDEARALPMPQVDGTLEIDMLPFYILLKELPHGIKKYTDRGFTKEEAIQNGGKISALLDICCKEEGRPLIKYAYFNWQFLHLYGDIINYGSLSFERQKSADMPLVAVKNKTTGEIVILADGVSVHKSGYILASSGYEDTDGSFEAKVTETENEIIGHKATEDARYEKTVTVFKKSEWYVIFRNHDPIVSFHIPRKVDFSEEVLDNTLKGGKEMLDKHFPEEKGRIRVCISWLMSPELIDMLGENSKLVKFGKRYVKFPILSQGDWFLPFIFPETFTKPTEEWTENTTLQRKIKELYLGGGRIHAFGGILIE